MLNIVETMKHIEEQALLKACAEIAKQREPNDFYRLWNGTAWERFEAADPKPPPRKHTAYTLEDLAGVAGLFKTERTVVFVGVDKVTAVLDADERRATVICPLMHTRDFTTLKTVEQKEYDQKELVQLLRVQFHGCVDQSLVGMFRNLKLQAENGVDANVQHGREAISKQIKREVTLGAGGAELPEEIEIATPVYDNLDLTPARVKCAVVLDMETLNFEIMPLNGELVKAQEAASRQIAEKLNDLVDPELQGRIFLGQP